MSYHIVADESVDFRIVVSLRNSGLKIYSIAEEQSSSHDEDVLKVAVSNNAFLLQKIKTLANWYSGCDLTIKEFS